MNNFDEWFKSEMPNTYAKKDSEKIEALVYSVALAAWNVQQARIDELNEDQRITVDDLLRAKAECIKFTNRVDELHDIIDDK